MFFNQYKLLSNFGAFIFYLIASQLLFSCANLERVSDSKEKSLESSNNQEFAYVHKSDKNSKDSSSQNLNPAVVTLLEQAAFQEASGQLELSSSTIERALRISPQSPHLHLSLAKLRLKQNQAHNALQLALKGQSLLNASDEVLAKDFWKIIGDSYKRLGDSARASQAYSHL